MPGPEILHGRAIDPLAVEARFRQPRRNQIERAPIIRREGSTGDELLREIERLAINISHDSITQQLVDGRLGARGRVNALHDDGTVQRVLPVRRGETAGHDH